jgi:predicted RNA binding protein YcfA (HicA-like mRNA interferase family)
MKYKEFAREIKAQGYVEERHGKGDHIIFRHPQWGRVVVPRQNNINRGLIAEMRCQIKRGQRGQLHIYNKVKNPK